MCMEMASADTARDPYIIAYIEVYIVVVLVFYGLSTLFKSFRARSVNLSTLFLSKPPRQFTRTLSPVSDN